MIRFVEMKGIHDDEKESFGFYDTDKDTFVNISGHVVFNSVHDFWLKYESDCGYELSDLYDLIKRDWHNGYK